jgi:hypothetical protein
MEDQTTYMELILHWKVYKQRQPRQLAKHITASEPAYLQKPPTDKKHVLNYITLPTNTCL